MSDYFAEPPVRLDLGGDPTPKYLRICRAMTEAIEAGQLDGGEALPSQRVMAEHYGVTLMTMRQALSLLAEQGLLRVEHGCGTFVASHAHRIPLDGLSSFAQQIIDTGRQLRNEILSAREIPTPQGVRARMGLTGSVVFCLTRLRWVDDQPLVYSMSLLHPSMAEQLDLDEVVRTSLYQALAEQCHVYAAGAVESFRAAAMSGDEAVALRRPVGAPALISSRLTFTRDGRPIVDDRAIMPGDAVVLSTERRVDDTALRYRLQSDDPLRSATR